MSVLTAVTDDVEPPGTRLPIGEAAGQPFYLDLERVLSGRLLIQGSSGAGKSRTLRRIIEEAFEFVTVMIVDPEGEFAGLAQHIGATTLVGADIAADGLMAAAARGRRHRLPLHLDLSDLSADERVLKAAAFFAGLVDCPTEDWPNTVLVAIDETQLLAPHMASVSRDAETRRVGVAALNDLCSRGRKRGIGVVISTPRLATVASSVISTLQNVLIGLNVFDRDVTRAADILGFTPNQAQKLRKLSPGDFFALGPALRWTPVQIHIGASITQHTGATPEMQGPADISSEDAAGLLDLTALLQAGADAPARVIRGGVRALDSFLLDRSAASAARIVEALRRIAPNATTGAQLAGHLGLEPDAIQDALDLLGSVGAVDALPRGDDRIARLAPRLRLRFVDAPVVNL